MTPFVQIWRYAQTLYSGYGYHTFNHAVEVMERAIRFGETATQHGISVDFPRLKIGCILHDAARGLDPNTYFIQENGACRPAPHNEAVHADVARHLLKRFGASEAYQNLIPKDILGTHPAGVLESVEAKLMAAADLAGLAGPYCEFHHDTELLRTEAAWLAGQNSITPQAFAHQTVGILAQYLARSIHITPEFYSETGQSRFHVNALGNLLTYIGSVSKDKQPHPVIGGIGCGKVPIILSENYLLPEGSVYIGIDANPTVRLPAVRLLQAHYKARQKRLPLAFVIPAEKQALSVPDATFERLYITNTVQYLVGFPLKAVRRAVKPGGNVTILETYNEAGPLLAGFSQVNYMRRIRLRFQRAGFAFASSEQNQTGWHMTLTNPY